MASRRRDAFGALADPTRREILELLRDAPARQRGEASLMAGEIASLLLSRMTVPVVYFLAGRRLLVPPRQS